MYGPCEKPSRLFNGICIGHSGNKQCEFLCQEGEYLLRGSCQMKTCVCYVC
ncbi:gamma-thionin family protein [Medicago truncatula]|uniref:Gamma-thionin family protein n=2 Tax=Medicago truncatula TaxID=3880 RepID=A0A072TLF3_MEDTR|nr:gamma-thionin family protein [Medicago truncatula]